MTSAGGRLVTAGAVGKAHGLDGSFIVDRPTHPLAVGSEVRLAGEERVVERRQGTDLRPLLRVSGIASREAVIALRGELLLMPGELAAGEWLAEDLIGCRVEGLGEVKRVIDLPSCDALELDSGLLVPLIEDAVRRVDVDKREIEVDRRFLKLEESP